MRGFLLVFLAVFSACKQAPPAKVYQMHGKVISVDAAAKTAVIDAGKIEGWMEAMTMEYPVPNPDDLKKLHPGAQISGTLEVRELNYTLKDVH